MNLRREWITPIVVGAFLLTGVTGVLIFFHVDTGMNKVVHEWLSWILLGGAALHAALNFTALKRHLVARRGQLVVGAFLLVLALSFAPLIQDRGEGHSMTTVQALSQAPIATLAEVAKITPDEMRQRLATAGVAATSDAQNLNELVGDTHRQMHILGEVLAPRRQGDTTF
jgi:hypothetical protein